MRISRAYAINGLLLLLALGSWALFLAQQQASRARQKAEAEAFHASILGTHLPQQASEIRLLLDAGNGDSIPAFPSLIGKIGSGEMAQIKAQGEFYVAMSLARKTTDSRAWKKLGKVQFLSAANTIMVTWQVYETPDRQLGFHQEGNFYRATGSSTELLDFIHDKQSAHAA